MQLRLYRSAEDAWQDTVRPWLEKNRTAVMEDREAWLITPNASLATHYKHRALAEGLTLFGIVFLEPWSLRKRLCNRLDVEHLALGRETLEFLLRLAAARRSTPEARSVALDPGDCLSALDDLGRAGWSGNEADLDEVPSPAREWISTLSRSQGWTPVIDDRLIEAARKNPRKNLTLLCAGWDAGQLTEWKLLQAAVATAPDLTLLVPSPRMLGDDPDAAWIEMLEQTFQADPIPCDDSGFEAERQDVADALARNDHHALKNNVPFRAAPAWQEQIDASLAQIATWLVEKPTPQRIGVIVPGPGPTAFELARRFHQLEWPFHHEVKLAVEREPALRFQQTLARLLRMHGDVEIFLELLNEARNVELSGWIVPDPIDSARLLHDLFTRTPVRSVFLLSPLIRNSKRSPAELLTRWLSLFEAWPDTLPWEEAKKRWEKLVRAFGLEITKLEPLWSRLDTLLAGEVIPAADFFTYLEGVFGALPLGHDAAANAPFSRIILTTLPLASQQTWDHFVLTDANEGVWPAPLRENPFLNDTQRQRLNQERSKSQGILLTSARRTSLEGRQLLDLIENCRGDFLILGTGHDVLDPGRELQPNEWVVRGLALEARRGTESQSALDLWRERLRREDPLLPEQKTGMVLNKAETDHLRDVHLGRQSGEHPFDAFFFNFGSSAQDENPWNATELEAALHTPATFAVGKLFDVESPEQRTFERDPSAPVGILAHRWLEQVLKGTETAPLALPLGPDNFTRLEQQRLAQEETWRQLLGDPLPRWWASVLRHAFWCATACLKRLNELPPGLALKTEVKAESEVATVNGPLKLRGRFDLVLESKASTLILDFKTGRNFQPASAASMALGKDGLQFAAYLALGLSLPISHLVLACITPTRLYPDVLNDEARLSLDPLFRQLAALQQSRAFGMHGPLHDDHQDAETLPLATRPIPQEILKAKRALTNGAFQNP